MPHDLQALDARYRRCTLYIFRGKQAIEEQGIRILKLEFDNQRMKRQLKELQEAVEVLKSNQRVDPAKDVAVEDAHSSA